MLTSNGVENSNCLLLDKSLLFNRYSASTLVNNLRFPSVNAGTCGVAGMQGRGVCLSQDFIV
eukprot:1528005-Ditylum_brightwellii.AAC.1